MAIGDLNRATAGEATDVHYVDVGLFDQPEYGSVYLVDAPRPAVIDTGVGSHVERVLDGLGELGIEPGDLASIVATHVHLDHAGGAGYLAEACPEADVYVHERGARHLVDPKRLWEGTKAAVGDRIEYYAEPRPVPGERLVELTDGDTIDLGDRDLRVHHAPGHAPHQVVLADPDSDGVFTADAAGIYEPEAGAVHPTSPPPDFDLETCLADVETIRGIDPSVLYYGHFGAAPAAGRLDEYERVLTDWVDDVRTAREQYSDDEAVLAHLQERAAANSAFEGPQATAEVAMNAAGVLRYLDQLETED